MIKIGLRAQNWPTDEEKLVLIEHIITGFGGHTTREIKLAFDMAIAGKLEVEVNSFENFSCLYFSNVMNAYRLWAKEEFKELPIQKELPPIEEPMDDTEFIEMNYRIWQTLGNPGMISTKCYGILVAQGKINLTQEEKDSMFEAVENVLKMKIANSKHWHQQLSPIYNSPNKKHWESHVFNECKRKSVENYFKTL